MASMIHNRAFGELSTSELYAIVQLRADVFVVEQQCVYPDLDGRDTETGTRHLFFLQEAAQTSGRCSIDSYLRILSNGDTYAIGRVVTKASQRGQGLAGRLITHALQTYHTPWTLSAQSHLEAWYERFGFVRNGADYDEDGIAHLPMRRTP